MRRHRCIQRPTYAGGRGIPSVPTCTEVRRTTRPRWAAVLAGDARMDAAAGRGFYPALRGAGLPDGAECPCPLGAYGGRVVGSEPIVAGRLAISQLRRGGDAV